MLAVTGGGCWVVVSRLNHVSRGSTGRLPVYKVCALTPNTGKREPCVQVGPEQGA